MIAYIKNFRYSQINCFNYLFLLFCLLQSGTMLAQDTLKRNPVVIGIRTHYGFIIPHSKAIAGVSNSNPFGMELNINKLLIKPTSWQKCYCESQVGISLSYFNFNSPTILGDALSSTVYFEPFIAARKKMFYSVRGSLGLSYLTRIYDLQNNPENQFFSMPVSFLLGVTFNAYYRLNNHTLLNLALNYNHISNGGFKQPNKGMNFPTIGVGIDYSWQTMRIPSRANFVKTPINKQLRKQIWAFGSLKTVNEPDSLPNEHAVIYGVAANIGKQIGRYHALHIGAELTADGFAKTTIARQKQDKDYHQFTVFVGHELLLGKFIFSQQIGVYLYNPFHRTDAIYQRYGLAYQVYKHLLIGATLKAHRQAADVFDIRVGWLFNGQ
jgi:hypothetical protein